METICPVCKVGMDTVDGRNVRCRVHGEVFQVLFRRAPVVAVEANRPEASVVEAAASDAGISSVASVPPPLPLIAPVFTPAPDGGMRCVQHPAVPATCQCSSCGGFLCTTCDFPLPGGLHVCPTCAVASQTSLAPRRKRALVWSFGLAIWGSVVLAAIMSGAFAGMVATEAGAQALGVLFLLLILIPAVVGFSISLGAINRRLVNPPSLWAATIWNAVLIVLFIVFCIIGLMS